MSEFGDELVRLMEARQVGVREVARQVPCAPGHISNLRQGKARASVQMAARLNEILQGDGKLVDLAQPPADLRQVLKDKRLPLNDHPIKASESAGADAGDAPRRVMEWVTGSNVSDEAIELLAQAASYLAEAHAQAPARKVLCEVLGLHREVQALLQGGKQRLRQIRDLMRTDSALLAHASLLLGDLGQNEVARHYGAASLLLAQEAEADEAVAWSVQAKTARWQNRFVEAAELARRGFEVSGPTPTKAELAYREANAIALFGDVPRARSALWRAERTAEALTQDQPGTSVWSFPAGRRAVFSLSVALHIGDPAAALSAAETADSCWSAGDPKVPATWAQVRAGAAMAHLMMDSLDGAAAEIAPVLELAQELRIRTVTGYLEKLERMLCRPHFADSDLAAGLREQIRDFNSAPAA
jgi:tetratricopeptide (TPR) repeat protein